MAQDGSREFISLLACICADGRALPPALIYQGTSGDLQDTWVQDIKEEDQAYFGSAPNGWSSNAFGLAFLKRFNQNTASISGRRRLLIVDGHSSHVNMAFINLCDQMRILVLVFPPHTTHRLQPLDVALFSPLSQAYSNEMTRITHGGQGWVSMTKRSFWSVFKVAWEKSFTTKNIKKGFEATGIWPLNPLKTVKKLKEVTIRPPTPPSAPVNGLPTPANSRAVRQLSQLPLTAKNYTNAHQLNVKLFTKLELANHENGQLKASLCNERSKRKRGKRLNLIGNVTTDEAQLFSPERIVKANEYQDSLDAAKQEELRQKDLRKADQERARTQRLYKEADAKLQRQAEKQMQKEAREAAEAANRARIEQNKAERAQKAQQKLEEAARRKLLQQQKKDAAAAAAAAQKAEAAKKGPSKRSKKKASNDADPVVIDVDALKSSTAPAPAESSSVNDLAAAVVDLTVDGPVVQSRSGRTVYRPARFLD